MTSSTSGLGSRETKRSAASWEAPPCLCAHTAKMVAKRHVGDSHGFLSLMLEVCTYRLFSILPTTIVLSGKIYVCTRHFPLPSVHIFSDASWSKLVHLVSHFADSWPEWIFIAYFSQMPDCKKMPIQHSASRCSWSLFWLQTRRQHKYGFRFQKTCKNSQSYCCPPMVDLYAKRLPHWGSNQSWTWRTRLIVMNPTGLGDKAEFLCEYSDTSMIYLISETQFSRARHSQRIQSVKRRNLNSVFGAPVRPKTKRWLKQNTTCHPAGEWPSWHLILSDVWITGRLWPRQILKDSGRANRVSSHWDIGRRALLFSKKRHNHIIRSTRSNDA